MAFGEVCGALLRAGESPASGGFGQVGHDGHDGGSGSERYASASFAKGSQAENLAYPAGSPVGNHTCDPGMKHDLGYGFPQSKLSNFFLFWYKND